MSNMKKIIILTITFSFIVNGCTLEEKKIQQQIEKARYCQTKNDCVPIAAQCPFDCHVIVNKNKAAEIEKIIMDFQSDCVYDCPLLSGFDCIDNACTAIVK